MFEAMRLGKYSACCTLETQNAKSEALSNKHKIRESVKHFKWVSILTGSFPYTCEFVMSRGRASRMHNRHLADEGCCNSEVINLSVSQTDFRFKMNKELYRKCYCINSSIFIPNPLVLGVDPWYIQLNISIWIAGNMIESILRIWAMDTGCTV